ncbi:MAG TPA: gamma-glutamyl-gamma-aminobutyrate hydrolase family protein [Xanthobacteraceae bacterium]|nr:gamma-glutamyl-gamma-aminobutyrate hydrolase family protein [Xanthobacteraceae bacterium]
MTPCSRLDDYVESVKRAGGEPRVLSNDDDPAAVLAQVDGVLLTGGLDVDPEHYGEAPHPLTEAAPDRDKFEIPLSREAVAQDVPLFAICRGVQVLNVAGGGTLVQDIPTAIDSQLSHAVNVPKDQIAHSVRVMPGSRLADALGTASDLQTCDVNSRHHQAVGRLAPAFVASAVSADGIVEAIERPDASFCLGVQWHPENFWRTGEFDGLFAGLIAAAKSRRKRMPTAD